MSKYFGGLSDTALKFTIGRVLMGMNAGKQDAADALRELKSRAAACGYGPTKLAEIAGLEAALTTSTKAS